MACGLWKKTGKEPGCVVHPGSFLLRRGGRVWGNGVSELPSRRLPISQKPLGRGPGEDLSEERSFLPSPHLHPYPFILIITSPPGTVPLSAPSIPLMPPESICAVKGLSPTD